MGIDALCVAILLLQALSTDISCHISVGLGSRVQTTRYCQWKNGGAPRKPLTVLIGQMFNVDARFKTDKQILMEFYSHHRIIASAVQFEHQESGSLNAPEHTCRLTLPGVVGFRGEVRLPPCFCNMRMRMHATLFMVQELTSTC